MFYVPKMYNTVIVEIKKFVQLEERVIPKKWSTKQLN